MSVWVEKKYTVGDGDFEPWQFLTICPAPDFPDDGVLLATIGKDSEDAFGKVYLQFSKELMRAIGESLIACCDDLEGAKNK